MLEDKKHTPLPWAFHIGEDYAEVFKPMPNDKADIGIAKMLYMDKANAEFIVRACNSHYELLRALRDAKFALSSNDNFKVTMEFIDKTIAGAEGE